MHLFTKPNFSKHANALRSQFEDRFANPHSNDAGRFVWDYWHVPKQYTVLRTPAYHFFQDATYRKFHEELVLWGRRNLGCHDVSPPWLSCYVDGCRQEFHADLPHGPWAFVFSLTPWKSRRFTGGETLMLQPKILQFWKNLDELSSLPGLEEEQIIREVPAHFNQLTVFDPRVPHAVRRVEGVHDPREGRLVIHGWFVQPRPFVEGPLKVATVQSAIDHLISQLAPLLDQNPSIRGLLSARFQVSPSGQVSQLKFLSNTLVAIDASQLAALKQIPILVKRTLLSRSMGRARGASWVTLPLIFDR